MENNKLGLRFHKISRQPVVLPKLDPLVAIGKSTNALRRRAISPLLFRDECGRNPVSFFAILSMQRSGNGWFEMLLNSHSNVSYNGENFHVLGRRRNISSIIQTLDRVFNLDWFTSASKNQCSNAVGFKWMLNRVKEASLPKPFTEPVSSCCHS